MPGVLRLRGALYILLEGRGHGLLPFEAELSIAPASTSTVHIASEIAVEHSDTERRFAAAIDRASFTHRLDIELVT
jgi:hypothetical protein